MRSRRRACSLALAVGLAGCAQSLDVGAHPDGSIDAALTGPDAAPDDAGAPDATDGDPRDGDAASPDATAEPACGSGPVLAVGLVSTDSPAANAVAMFAVGASAVRRCPDITARGGLPVPQAIGWIDAERMIVGDSTALAIVSATGDHVIGARAHTSSSATLVDAFGIVDASGEAWGVATDTLGGDSIRTLRMLRARDLMQQTVPLGGATFGSGCDASPTDPSRAVCVVGGAGAAAWQRDPFLVAPPDTWIEAAGVPLVELDVLGERIVWIEDGPETDSVRESVGGLRGSVGAPSSCASALCGAALQLHEVAVDPTRPGGYFAICVHATDRRFHLVRGSTEADGAECETILDGHALPPALNAFSLALRE